MNRCSRPVIVEGRKEFGSCCASRFNANKAGCRRSGEGQAGLLTDLQKGKNSNE